VTFTVEKAYWWLYRTRTCDLLPVRNDPMLTRKINDLAGFEPIRRSSVIAMSSECSADYSGATNCNGNKIRHEILIVLLS